MKKFNPVWGLIAGVFAIMIALLFIATAKTYSDAIAAGIIAWAFGVVGGVYAGVSYLKLKS